MKRSLLLLLIIIFTGKAFTQSIEEKEIFELKFKGNAELYSYKYDSKSGNYCYAYHMPEEKKSFIISPKGESEKYDYFMPLDIKFDSKGNYFAAAGNYLEDYGPDNNFLIINGKTVKGLQYIESFSSFINSKDEYVFVYKINDEFYFGYAKGDGSVRESEKYDNIKPIYKYIQGNYSEGAEDHTDADYFYLNDTGERGFIVIKDGKAGIMFGEDITMTDHSDISESSLTLNNNGELTFIAKDGGRFYEKAGNEFVVSGSKKYKSFDFVYPPVLFDGNNEPVYTAADSIREYVQNKYAVKGEEKYSIDFGTSGSKTGSIDIYDINNMKLSEDGKLSYFATHDEIIYADLSQENSYDQYYAKSYFVNDGKAFPLGYNIGKVIYDAGGNMIYSGIADIQKKEYLLMQSNGESIIITGQGNYDLISDYGLLDNGDYYYFGQKLANAETGEKGFVKYCTGTNTAGEFYNVSYQYYENGAVMIQFSPDGNNYVICANEEKGNGEYISNIVTKNGKMKFPDNTLTGKGMFLNILNVLYTKDSRLFYTGITEMDTTDYTNTEEIFTDDKSLGKYYNLVQNLKYNKSTNTISFLASRKNKIYSVSVKF